MDGLGLLVSPTGSIRWRFRFRDTAGKEQRHSIGKYPDVGIEAARRKAQDLGSEVAAGQQLKAPRKAKASARAAVPEHRVTLAEAAATWLARPGAPWGPGHAERVGKRLVPVLNKLRRQALADITPAILLPVLQKLAADRGPEFCATALTALGGIFQTGAVLGHCAGAPTAGLAKSGLLPGVKISHHPSITDPVQTGELLRAIEARMRGTTTDAVLSQTRLAPRRVLIENWRRHYNEVRPHSSLQYMTPIEINQQHATSTNPEAAL